MTVGPEAIPAVALQAFQFYREGKPPLGGPIAIGPAAGIVAVLYAESKLEIGSQGIQASETGGVLNPHGAYGVASWNGARQKALKDFAVEKGWSEGQGDIPLEIQLAFVLTECANSYPQTWSAIEVGLDVSHFISQFVLDYERPKDVAAEAARALPLGMALAALAGPPEEKSSSATGDAEIAALGALWAILGPLTSVARNRIMAYLAARSEAP
jgi:Phage tail lysozyme